jgi:hypothetical protein
MASYAGRGGRYGDTLAELLRFARNAHEHPPAGAELAPLVRVLQEAGAPAAGMRRERSVAARRRLLAEYLLALFPALPIACYEVMSAEQLDAVLGSGSATADEEAPSVGAGAEAKPRRKAQQRPARVASPSPR